MIKDTILCWKGGQWCWDGIEEIPAHLGPWMAKIKIGLNWSDKEVSVFVTDFVSQFLEDDV